MSWTKKTPLEGKTTVPCLCCGAIAPHLSMDDLIAIGFGSAFVEKNGEAVLDGEHAFREEGRLVKVSEAEALAEQDPDNDWRIHIDGPLYDKHYQRQAEGLWVLYDHGPGFA